MTGTVVRHALALIGAAFVMAALGTVAAFIAAGMWETEGAAVAAATQEAGLVLISAFVVFNLTAGLAVLMVLRRIGRRGYLAHALGGAVAGVVFALVTAQIFSAETGLEVVAVLAVAGALMLVLTRAFLRRDAAERSSGEGSEAP